MISCITLFFHDSLQTSNAVSFSYFYRKTRKYIFARLQNRPDNALFGSFYGSPVVLTDRGLTSSRREWRRHGEIRFVLARPASGTCTSWSSRDDTTVLLALALPAESQTKSIHPDETMGLPALKNGGEENRGVAQLSCCAYLTRYANAKSAFDSRLLKSILQTLPLWDIRSRSFHCIWILCLRAALKRGFCKIEGLQVSNGNDANKIDRCKWNWKLRLSQDRNKNFLKLQIKKIIN